MANTSQPLSEVAIANMGGSILEERELTSLDDNTTYGRFAAREFGYVRDELLEMHPWIFNKTLDILAPDGTAPAFGWRYQYTLPADFVRLEPIRDSYPNGRKLKYQRMGKKIYTDSGPSLPIIYGRKITNAADFDPLFARVLGSRLAVLACQRVTGKAAYFDKAITAYNIAWFEAVRTNAQEKGSDDYVDNGYEGGGEMSPSYSVMDARGRAMSS